ncbi:MAG: hypothetical protein ABSC05_31850 [Candidatus Solibacter sp.]|jgi:hypothetical protein
MQTKEANGALHNPTAPLDVAAVREELERILASPQFRNSKRHSCFLRYVVEETLNGEAGQLKERTVGVKVFGLDPGYDTSSNPVVRVSAGELRKRLLQYYHAPDHGGELRIDLPPGSYVPEFGPAPVEAVDPAAATPARRWRSGGMVAAAAIGVTAVVGLAFWLKPWVSQDAFEQFWAPVWDSPGQALLVVAARSQSDESGRPPAERMSLNDAMALARLTPVLAAHGKDFRILTQSSATLADLKQGSAIFIGAFSNELSMRLMREARFNFELDPATNLPRVRDRQNPTSSQWRLQRAPADAAFTDYAIVSRVRDPATGHLAVVAGGITARGTRAVGEFLSSAPSMAAISRQSAKEWHGRNVQIVLAIPVTPAAAGPSRVLTTYSW